MGSCLSRPPGAAQEKAAVQAYERFNKSSDVRDLQSAIVHYREAAEAQRSFPDKYAVTAITLANTIWQHYERTEGKPQAELDEVISRFREALNIWQAEDPKPDDYPTLLVNLGNSHRELFIKNENDDEALRHSIQYYESARAFKDSHPEKYADATLMLGTMLWTRCEKQDHDRRLKDAINYLTEAHKLFDGKPSAALCVYNLAGAYLTLSTKPSATPEDLDFAIENYQAAVDLYQSGHPHHGLALYNLSQALMRRYNSKRQPSDLKGAKKYAISAKKAVPTDLRPKLDEILEFVKSEMEGRRDEQTVNDHVHGSTLSVPNTTGGKSKKRSKANLRTTAQAAPASPYAGSPALVQTISHANTFSDTDSRTQNSTPTSTFYNRDPNKSNATFNSSRGTSRHQSTDNLRTIVEAVPGDIPLVNVTPAPSVPVKTSEQWSGHTKNTVATEQSSTSAFNGRDSQRSGGLYPIGQNTSKQKSKDDLRTSTQVLLSYSEIENDGPTQVRNVGRQTSTSAFNNSYPNESNDAHSSSQVTARHKSKDNLRTAQVPVSLVNLSPASSAPTNERNGRTPISTQESSTASFYSRSANGSGIDHHSFQESSQPTSNDNLRNGAQPVPLSSWNGKNTMAQQPDAQLTSHQNSDGNLRAANQASNPISYQSIAPSASVSSQNGRDSQTATAAFYGDNSKMSYDAQIFGQGSSGASGPSAVQASPSNNSKLRSQDTANHTAALEYRVNSYTPPSDPANTWNGKDSRSQKAAAAEQISRNQSIATSAPANTWIETGTPVKNATPKPDVSTGATTSIRDINKFNGNPHHLADQAVPALEPRYRDAQRVNGLHSGAQRSSGHKSKDNLRVARQSGSDDNSRFE